MSARRGGSNVTIRDIAAKLGLTHTTVSRALNDHAQTNAETKVRVRAAARQLGYIPNSPAQLMRRQRSTLVGLVVPDMKNPLAAAIARAMTVKLANSGMQLMLAISADDPEIEYRQILALRSAQVMGIAVMFTAKPLAATIGLLKHVPSVQLLRYDKRGPKWSVVVDDYAGVREAVLHLLQLGHRRIGYIGPTVQVSTGVERLRGFEEAHREFGLEPPTKLIHIGLSSPEFGREAYGRLMNAKSPPTAVFLGSQRLTLGFLECANDAGILIPRDLSIVCYGDADWFVATNPQVTAVYLPLDEVADSAIDLLMSARLEAAGGESVKASVLPTHLVLRHTTAPIPGALAARRSRR